MEGGASRERICAARGQKRKLAGVSASGGGSGGASAEDGDSDSVSDSGSDSDDDSEDVDGGVEVGVLCSLPLMHGEELRRAYYYEHPQVLAQPPN